MDISFVSEGQGQALALMCESGPHLGPSAQAFDARLNAWIAEMMARYRFTGAEDRILDLPGPAECQFARILVIGIGGPKNISARTWERWAGHAVKRLQSAGLESLVLQPECTAAPGREIAVRAAIGARLAAFRFDTYRTKLKAEERPTLKAVRVVTPDPQSAVTLYDRYAPVIDGVSFARELVCEPANVLYPEAFVERLQPLADLGVGVDVLGVEVMQQLGMGALLAVGQGSIRPPRLVILSWYGAGEQDPPVLLVGKGVTFDSGGLSLKTAASMETMKGDMAGAAAVAGVVKALALRKARANVVGVLALAENMPDGNAIRPGDIVSTMSGQTIEILNTDAEGRLILADALCYGQEKFKPRAVVDLATLTGAVATALGREYAACFSTDDALAAALIAAGEAEGDRVWRLPLDPAYDKMLDSVTADVKNIPTQPLAGSIVGAQFLKRFVRDGLSWAHLDIYGVAMKPGPYDDPTSPVWATGFGVRLINRLISDCFEAM